MADLAYASLSAADRRHRGGGERREGLRRMPRHHYAHVAQRPDRAQGEFILIASPPLFFSFLF